MPYKKIVIGNLLYGNLLYLLFCLLCFLGKTCMNNELCLSVFAHDLFFVFFYALFLLISSSSYIITLYFLFSINFSAAIFLIFMFYFIKKEPRRNWKSIAFMGSFAVMWLSGGIFKILFSFFNEQNPNYLESFFIGIFIAIVFIIPALFAIPMALYNKKVFPKYADSLLSKKKCGGIVIMPYKKIVIGNLLYGNLLYLLFCFFSFFWGICAKNKACSQYLHHDLLSVSFSYIMGNIYKVTPYLLFSINFSAAIFLIFMFYFIKKEPNRNWKTIAFMGSFAVVWLCGGIFEVLFSFSEVLSLNNLKAFFIGISAAIIFIVPTLFAIPMALYNEKVFPKYAASLLSQRQ